MISVRHLYIRYCLPNANSPQAPGITEGEIYDGGPKNGDRETFRRKEEPRYGEGRGLGIVGEEARGINTLGH